MSIFADVFTGRYVKISESISYNQLIIIERVKIMICNKCGYENSLDTDICPKCGHKYKRIGKSSKFSPKNRGGKAGKDSKNNATADSKYFFKIITPFLYSL